MGKHLRAILVGSAVFTVLLIGFGMYSWTAIHSGWTAFGRSVFGIALP